MSIGHIGAIHGNHDYIHQSKIKQNTDTGVGQMLLVNKIHGFSIPT